MLTSEPTPSDASHRLSRSFLTSQMKELGDPMRRGADHGEAFGASIKDDLHNRTLRRMKATAATTHKRYGPDGEVVHEWTQRALAVSRVMQVWRDVIVRNRLLEDEASSPYLQRKHCVLKDTGYARAAAACAREPKGIPASVQEKMKEAFDNA